GLGVLGRRLDGLGGGVLGWHARHRLIGQHHLGDQILERSVLIRKPLAYATLEALAGQHRLGCLGQRLGERRLAHATRHGPGGGGPGAGRLRAGWAGARSRWLIEWECRRLAGRYWDSHDRVTCSRWWRIAAISLVSARSRRASSWAYSSSWRS